MDGEFAAQNELSLIEDGAAERLFHLVDGVLSQQSASVGAYLAVGLQLQEMALRYMDKESAVEVVDHLVNELRRAKTGEPMPPAVVAIMREPAGETARN